MKKYGVYGDWVQVPIVGGKHNGGRRIFPRKELPQHMYLAEAQGDDGKMYLISLSRKDYMNKQIREFTNCLYFFTGGEFHLL